MKNRKKDSPIRNTKNSKYLFVILLIALVGLFVVLKNRISIEETEDLLNKKGNTSKILLNKGKEVVKTDSIKEYKEFNPCRDGSCTLSGAVSFDYPKDWIVKAYGGDNSPGTLYISSPDLRKAENYYSILDGVMFMVVWQTANYQDIEKLLADDILWNDIKHIAKLPNI